VSIIGTLNKQPAEVRRLSIDYAGEFLSAGEQVTSATITTTDAALYATITSSFPATSVTALVSGGVDGEIYTVTVRADITDGQRIESEIIVPVEEISQ
jgi:hypothetical protein